MVRIWVACLFAVTLSAADCPPDGPLWMVQVRALGAPTLTVADFELKVDGKPRSICGFTRQSGAASIALVWDTSGSMRYSHMTDFASRTVDQLFKSTSGDEWLLVEAGDRATVKVPLTFDLQVVRAGIRQDAWGKTALLDGIRAALEGLQAAHTPTRAVLVVSDAEDSTSRQTFHDLSLVERSAPAPVFVLAFVPGDGIPLAPRKEVQSTRERLSIWARESGGYFWPLRRESDMNQVLTAVGTVLRSPYLLRFAGPPGKVKVDVRSRPRPTLLYRAEPDPIR